jgi:hypothetical protein
VSHESTFLFIGRWFFIVYTLLIKTNTYVTITNGTLTLHHPMIAFFTVFVATLSALFVFKIINSVFFEKQTPPVFSFIEPADSLQSDLGRAFQDVNSRLPLHRKASAFPMMFDIGTHQAWCSYEQLVQIVSGQLEQAGWVVSRSAECGPTEIILDVPRVKF